MIRPSLTGFLVWVLVASAQSAFAQSGTLRSIALYTVCSWSGASCPHRREVRAADEGYGARTPQTPIFETEFPVGWTDCVQFERAAVCLMIDHRDLARLNQQLADHPLREAALTANERIIAILGIRGEFKNPIAIRSLDDDDPPNALETFLVSSSVGP